jgi:hypothetical protein
VASRCPALEHGDGALTMTATGTQSTFVDGGALKLSRVMHTVELSKLSPGVKYNYRVGDPATADGWSKVFAFTAKRSPAQIASVGRTGTGIRILAYCDMGHRESSGVLAGAVTRRPLPPQLELVLSHETFEVTNQTQRYLSRYLIDTFIDPFRLLEDACL